MWLGQKPAIHNLKKKSLILAHGFRDFNSWAPGPEEKTWCEGTERKAASHIAARRKSRGGTGTEGARDLT